MVYSRNQGPSPWPRSQPPGQSASEPGMFKPWRRELFSRHFVTRQFYLGRMSVRVPPTLFWSLSKWRRYWLRWRATHSVLPTGYGKTVIFQMLPYAAVSSPDLVVVNPLNAIMEEQSQRFGTRCLVIDEAFVQQLTQAEGEEAYALFHADVRFLIGHPENLLNDNLKKFLRDTQLSKKVIIWADWYYNCQKCHPHCCCYCCDYWW